jgi:hypothetical protein
MDFVPLDVSKYHKATIIEILTPKKTRDNDKN